MSNDLLLRVPSELIEALSARVADHILERMQDEFAPSTGRWMRTHEAAEYLGWTRSALYKQLARRSIPHYKIDRTLLFKRDDLDAWIRQHRVEPFDAPMLDPRKSAGRRPTAQTAHGAHRRRAGQRSLPPPVEASSEDKARWAHQLELSPAELDEMDPREFRRQWEARNRRLDEAGVFDRIDELQEKYGALEQMTLTELIRAVGDLATHV